MERTERNTEAIILAIEEVERRIYRREKVVLCSTLPEFDPYIMEPHHIHEDMIDLLTDYSTYSKLKHPAQRSLILPNGLELAKKVGIDDPEVHNFVIDDPNLGKEYTCQIITQHYKDRQ